MFIQGSSRTHLVPVFQKKLAEDPVAFTEGNGASYTFKQHSASFREGDPSFSPQYTPAASRTSSSTARNVNHGFPENVLPPRHRRPRGKRIVDSKNIKIEGTSLFLAGLSHSTDKAQIRNLLHELGFSDQITITLSEGYTACVNFSHPHVADVACTVLLCRGQVLWDFQGGTQDDPLEIDLVNDENDRAGEATYVQGVEWLDANSLGAVGTPIVVESTEDLYGNLSKDIYEDNNEGIDTSNDSDCDSMHSPELRNRLQPLECWEHPNLLSDRNNLTVHLPQVFEIPFSNVEENRAQLNKGKSISKRLHSTTFRTNTYRDTSKIKRVQTSDSHTVNTVPIPKSPHNRARRVLLPTDSELPVATVSMRGDIQFYSRQKPQYRLSQYSIPNHSSYRHTVDATVIGDTGVIVYDHGPCQASILQFSSEDHSPSLKDIHLNPHTVSLDARNPTEKAGRAVSCLAAKPMTSSHINFFTGGYDRTLHIWTVKKSGSMTTERLTKLSTIPEALAFRDKTLLIGTSTKLVQVDLGHLASTPITAQLSNTVHQIHINEQAPKVTLLETNNLDLQIQIFDERVKRGFNRTAECSFGCRQSTSLTKSNRGGLKSYMFVKGYPDGTVRLWDYRNVKQAVETQKYEDMGPIIHTIFAGDGIICYEENSLAFLDIL